MFLIVSFNSKRTALDFLFVVYVQRFQAVLLLLIIKLQELCGLVRHLQATQRNALLSRLVELGLFEVMSSVLQSGDDEARLKATDILLADASHDPMPLRNFLVQENNELLPLLINAFVTPSSSGLQEQVLEILKVLLDPDTMDTQVEKDAFCDRFYKVELCKWALYVFYCL